MYDTVHVPGLGIVNWVPDVMHCKHIGSDQNLYGSTLYVLTYYIMHDSPEDNMEYLWELIGDYYKAHDILIGI